MGEFDFLRSYIEHLPHQVRNNLEYPFILMAGKNEAEIKRFEVEAGIVVPNELRQFYQFSYGARLNDYEIFTVPQIVKAVERLSSQPEYWKNSIFPFARVIDVGDIVAFDLEQFNENGLLILDGFHEFPPIEWEGICFGLKMWLTKMAESDFKAFWLSSSDKSGLITSQKSG